MTDFENHIPYFSTIYSLYQSASSSAKTEVLKSLINYGNFPAFIYYLNQIWFQSNVTQKIATENMEFLILYFGQANKMHADIDYGQLSELAQFLIRIFYQKAQPKNFKNYGEFLLHIFEKVKALEANSIFDVLIKCPFESALFPLSIFGVVNSNYNSKVFKLLFSLYSAAFQKEETKNIWIESFIVLLSNKIQKYDHYSPKIIDKIKNILSDSSIISDKKLKILYSCTNSLKEDEVIELYKKFYGALLRNISPKTTPEGISYIFKVSTEYYKILIPQNKENKDENDKKNIELVLNPLFSSALSFFFYSSEVEKSAVDFFNQIEPNILQQYITSIVEDPSFIRASLFFVSHFPTEKTIQVLFKPINNQIYLNAQREAIIYFLSHFACPPHQLSIAFALLKASDFEENESIDKIIDSNPVLYCSSVIKYITFCIDGIEKVIHFSDIFLKKKTIPIVPAPKYLNHSVLTLSVHFFGYKKYVKSISALISYLKACKENSNSNSDKEKNSKDFDYFSCYNDETHIWPNFVHEALTSDDEWREDLCNLSLQRLGKQEFQQCIVLAAISKDPMILHNSALLLLKDSKMIPVLFTASATNWEKETLNEIKNIVNEYSKDQQVESKRGFFSSLFSRSTTNESSYKPKIDVFPIVLNLIPVITQVLPFSSSLFDLLFTVFPSDQKPQYMTLTCKAIYSVCNLINKDERQIIHSIIDRLCNSNLSLCDISIFEQTLIKSLSVNQSMTEELASKISSLYLSLVLKKQISDNSLFEETFLNDYYGELTLNAFTKVLLLQISKNDDNEQIFGSFYRMLKNSSAKNVSYFQRFDHVLISNLFSNSNFIRKVCFKSLNLIEKMNFDQEEIEKISKINSTDPNLSNESLLYFRLTLSKSFVDCLAKKFTYKSSLILIEILLHHFTQVSYNNQVSIANFINSTLNLYADKYLEEKKDEDDENTNNSLLVSLFKQFRKIEISNLKCLNNEYIDIIVRLAKVKSKKFVPLLLEQTTMQILNENHLTALCNVDSFIPLFIEAVLDLIKNKENLTVEVISRAAQILGILIDQRDAFDFKYHDDYVILFIVLACLTSASLPKWTTSFKAQHFKNLSSIFAKFASLTNEETSKFTDNFLNNMNEGGVVVFSAAAQFKLHFNLLKVIQMLLERTRIESSAFDKLNDTVFFFLKYFCIAIKMKISNSNEDFESQFNILVNEFENKVFVNEYLPSVLFYLSDCLTIERLKDLRKNKKEILLMIFMSLVSFFENYSKNTKVDSFSQTAQTITKDESLTAIKKKISPLYASLSPSSLSNSPVRYNSILFMRIVLVMEKKYIKAKINVILKTMNIFVLYDPNVLSLVEFSASLLKIIKIESDPSYFITNFNIIIIKMASSIISHRTESRQISCYFLSHLLKPDPKPNDPSKNENDNNNNINSDENNNANNDENIDVISYGAAEQIDFKSLFSNLSSSYDEIDKSQKRYIELAKSVLSVASSEFEIHQQNKEKTSLEDIERLAAVMLPLYKKENESKSTEQEVISKFVEFLKTVAASSDLDVLNPIINMITEFTSLF